MAKTALDLAREAVAAQRPGRDPAPATTLADSRGDEFVNVESVADLGKLVRACRKQRRLSQQAFADLAGVGRRFLSELENGKPTLEVAKVITVAAACGLELFVRAKK